MEIYGCSKCGIELRGVVLIIIDFGVAEIRMTAFLLAGSEECLYFLFSGSVFSLYKQRKKGTREVYAIK